jgi:predicted metal-dependent hydrolase
MQQRFHDGVIFFNNGRFFDAHEAWEDVWRDSIGEERTWLRGMTQLAVAMHHYASGNREGAVGVMSRAVSNLSHCPNEFREIDCGLLRDSARHAYERLKTQQEISAFKIRPLDR